MARLYRKRRRFVLSKRPFSTGARVVRRRAGLSRGIVLRRAYGGALRRSRLGWGAYLGYEAYRAIRGKFSRRNIGDAPGTSSAKSVEQESHGDFLATRTLYNTDLTSIGHTTSNEINGRQRNAAYVSGFKLCFELRNTTAAPLYWNVAVISFKTENAGDKNFATDFFRNPGGATARSIDFGNTNLKALTRNCYPINTDKFTILKHKRLKLSGKGNVDYNGELQNTMNMNMYIPLKRQVRWDTTAQNNPVSGSVYLVYWIDLFGDNSVLPIPDAAVMSHTYTTYFRDT